jgi:hypothetical protein
MKTYALIFITLFTRLFSFAQVTVQTNLPSSLAPGDYLVEVKINKGAIANFAKYQMDVPAGVTVKEGDTRTGNFTFDDNRAKIVWVSIPSEAEFVVTFKMNFPNAGPATFNHKFYYLAEEGKKEVEFDAITVNFDASAQKEVASLGGRASADPNEATAKTTATITTSSGEVTSTATNNSNTSTEPVKTNNETIKSNTEPVKTNTEPVKTNTEPVVKNTSAENTKPAETKPVETAKTNNSSSTASPGLVFKVQIGAYGENPSPSLFKKLSDKVTVVKEGGFYKALVGRFNTKEEAIEKINELKGVGFQGFLVRYQDGVRVK